MREFGSSKFAALTTCRFTASWCRGVVVVVVTHDNNAMFCVGALCLGPALV